MLPSSDERVKFVDLIKISLLYFCLEDKYLQEQLCNIKDDDITLKKFLGETWVAEQKRCRFHEIEVSSSHLDSSAGVSVNKWEARCVDCGKAMWQEIFDKSGSGQAQGFRHTNAVYQVQKSHPQTQQTLWQQAQQQGAVSDGSTGARNKKKSK